MPTYRCTFPGLPQELREARNWTRNILSGYPYANDAALIVTELGTNALVHTTSGHTTGTFHVALALSDHVVAISVTDSGSTDTTPQVQRPDDQTPHGRGLGMVTALATRVQVHGDHRSRTITAELRIPTHQDGTPWQ